MILNNPVYVKYYSESPKERDHRRDLVLEGMTMDVQKQREGTVPHSTATQYDVISGIFE